MNYEIFENLKDLEKSYPKLSTELLQNFDIEDYEPKDNLYFICD